MMDPMRKAAMAALPACWMMVPPDTNTDTPGDRMDSVRTATPKPLKLRANFGAAAVDPGVMATSMGAAPGALQ